MKTSYTLPLLVVALLCTSCEKLNPHKTSRSALGVAGSKDTRGTLFVWDSDVSAAVAYPHRTISEDGAINATAICMQRAMTAGAVSAEVSAAINDTAAALINPNAKVTGEPLTQGALAVSNAITTLAVSTERTAYVDTTLFYLCQLHANGGLNSAQLDRLVGDLIEKSTAMQPVHAELTQLVAPDLAGRAALARERAAAKRAEATEAEREAKRLQDEEDKAKAPATKTDGVTQPVQPTPPAQPTT